MATIIIGCGLLVGIGLVTIWSIWDDIEGKL